LTELDGRIGATSSSRR